MEKIEENKKPKMLLHSCCGPCSSAVIFVLKNDYDITVLYYNPNIYPEEEYLKRKHEQIKLIESLNKEGENIKLLDVEYDPENYEKFVCGLEKEKEGGARCTKCFELRLRKTAKLAKENGFDIFATTLTVSPHKNAPLINSIGESISKEMGEPYLVSDFKKKDGYKRSIELSKKYELYRQNYCGCKYSRWFDPEFNGQNDAK